MAASGFTPISLYYSTTASAVPTSGNLANGELGLNIADMKLYAKNSAGTVTLLASNAGASGSVTSVSGTGTVNGLTLTGTVTTSGSLTLGGTLSLVSPPPIGSTTPNTGVFTTLSATGNLTSLTAQFGTNPASVSVGVIGIPNQKRMYGRNTTNSADINILFVDGNNNVILGPNDNATFTQTNLGIGTASPNFSGFGSSTAGVQVTNANNAAFRLNGNAGGDFYFVSGSGQHWLYATGAVPIGVYTNSTQRFVFGASGQFGIGASPSYGTAGQVLTSGGASAAPTWATAGGGGQVFAAFGGIESVFASQGF